MKILTASQAALLIEDGCTVAATGFGGFGHPEAITSAIGDRFVAEGHPLGLALHFAASNGDRKSRGMNHLSHEGMVRRIVAGGWRGTPKLAELALANRIEAYCLPQGVIAQLFRVSAAGQPGLVTTIGLDTFVDPRWGGGRLNDQAQEALVELMVIGGKEHLFYKSPRFDCALIRATTADERGNLSMEHEAFPQDALAIAQAAHNAGGIVIAQVKRLAQAGSLHPNAVRVPGILVDYVVPCSDPAKHWISFGEQHNPAYTGEVRAAIDAFAPPSLNERKIIQRRAFLELTKSRAGAVINLGIGLPAGIGRIAREEGFTNFTPTVEAGPIGGIPAEELSFGASANPEAVLDQAAQFDFYGGGGLDIAFLGMGEVDLSGNVNVSRLGGQIIGVGGFIDISQSAQRTVFLGTMTAGGLRVTIGERGLAIEREGRIRKIVETVEHLSFNGQRAVRLGKPVLYITERAVFELHDGALTLIEYAPGLDLERDVLALAPPRLKVSADLKHMCPELFASGPMRVCLQKAGVTV